MILELPFTDELTAPSRSPWLVIFCEEANKDWVSNSALNAKYIPAALVTFAYWKSFPRASRPLFLVSPEHFSGGSVLFMNNCS